MLRVSDEQLQQALETGRRFMETLAMPELDTSDGPPWKPFDGPLPGDVVPKGRNAMFAVYGDPKVTYVRDKKTKQLIVKVDKAWAAKNMMMAHDLPGGIEKLYVHRLVEPYLREALRRATIIEPGYMIARIGCFAPRFQRHDPSRPLSDHTLGIAFDVNPSENRAYDGRKQGEPIKTDMPMPWVEAWESVGFVWGGRWAPYCDPMHFQLRRL